MMKTLIANLPADHDKRTSIQAECDRLGLDYEIIDAVYDKALSDEQLKATGG